MGEEEEGEDGEDWEYQEELELPRKELQGPYYSQEVHQTKIFISAH